MAVKVYKNTTKQKMNVVGVGEIPAGEQVSLSGNYLPPVILENYPGLVDLEAEEQAREDE